MELASYNIKKTKKKISLFRQDPTKHPNPGLKKRHDMIAAIVEKFHPNRNAEILDMGGREGFLCDALKRLGYKNFYIIDLSKDAIEYAKERGYDGEVLNIEDVGKINKKFDIVTASHVIEHCKSPQKSVNGVWQILNRNGIFVIEVPIEPARSKNIITGGGHWHIFSSKSDLMQLFDNSWKLLLTDDTSVTGIDIPFRVAYKKLEKLK